MLFDDKAHKNPKFQDVNFAQNSDSLLFGAKDNLAVDRVVLDLCQDLMSKGQHKEALGHLGIFLESNSKLVGERKLFTYVHGCDLGVKCAVQLGCDERAQKFATLALKAIDSVSGKVSAEKEMLLQLDELKARMLCSKIDLAVGLFEFSEARSCLHGARLFIEESELPADLYKEFLQKGRQIDEVERLHLELAGMHEKYVYGGGPLGEACEKLQEFVYRCDNYGCCAHKLSNRANLFLVCLLIVQMNGDEHSDSLMRQSSLITQRLIKESKDPQEKFLAQLFRNYVMLGLNEEENIPLEVYSLPPKNFSREFLGFESAVLYCVMKTAEFFLSRQQPKLARLVLEQASAIAAQMDARGSLENGFALINLSDRLLEDRSFDEATNEAKAATKIFERKWPKDVTAELALSRLRLGLHYHLRSYRVPAMMAELSNLEHDSKMYYAGNLLRPLFKRHGMIEVWNIIESEYVQQTGDGCPAFLKHGLAGLRIVLSMDELQKRVMRCFARQASKHYASAKKLLAEQDKRHACSLGELEACIQQFSRGKEPKTQLPFVSYSLS